MATWATDVTPDWKPEKRFKASAKEWAEIHEYFRGQSLLGRDELYNPDNLFHCLHHIAFKKADSGDDMIENLAPLFTADHTRFHDRATGWERVATAVRVYVLTNRGRCTYVIGKIGWERFSKRYPLLSESDGSTSSGPSQPSDSESDWDHYEEPIWRIRRPSEAIEGHERWQGPF